MTHQAVAMSPWPGLKPFSRELEFPEGGGVLFLYDTGPVAEDGPVFVLVHGLGDEADSWRHLVPLLSPHFRVMALDLPGFGRSLCEGQVNFQSHVKAVEKVLDSFPGGAILTGSSMGAVVSLAAAFTNHGKVRALALLDGGLPLSGRTAASANLRALPVVGERWYRALRKNPEAAYRSLEPFYGDFGALSGEDRSFLKKRVAARVESESQMRAYFSSYRSLAALNVFCASRYAKEIAAFPGRLFIGWGENDRIVPLSSARAMRDLRPDAGFAVFAGAGHLPHQERPKDVAEKLIELAVMETA